VIYPGERPLHALRERGVEYVEVRLLDLDPFVPVGITAQTMRFIDVFLLHCLLEHSPPDSPQEITELAHNQHRVAARGREPGLTLERAGQEVPLAQWGSDLVAQCRPIARALDAAHGGTQYTDALNNADAALADPSLLPSARVLAAMQGMPCGSFVPFIAQQSLHTRQHLLDLPFGAAQQSRFEAMTTASVAAQKAIEAADTMPFDVYLPQYLSPERLVVKHRRVEPATA
jgi:glutamate--cysteine ligase